MAIIIVVAARCQAILLSSLLGAKLSRLSLLLLAPRHRRSLLLLILCLLWRHLTIFGRSNACPTCAALPLVIVTLHKTNHFALAVTRQTRRTQQSATLVLTRAKPPETWRMGPRLLAAMPASELLLARAAQPLGAKEGLASEHLLRKSRRSKQIYIRQLDGNRRDSQTRLAI